jgi:hypothetical protein
MELSQSILKLVGERVLDPKGHFDKTVILQLAQVLEYYMQWMERGGVYCRNFQHLAQTPLRQSDTFQTYHFERSIEKAPQHIRFLCTHNCLNFRTCLIHVEACLLVFALTDKITCRAQAVTQANRGLRSLWITCAASTMAVFAVRGPGAGSN